MATEKPRFYVIPLERVGRRIVIADDARLTPLLVETEDKFGDQVDDPFALCYDELVAQRFTPEAFPELGNPEIFMLSGPCRAIVDEVVRGFIYSPSRKLWKAARNSVELAYELLDVELAPDHGPGSELIDQYNLAVLFWYTSLCNTLIGTKHEAKLDELIRVHRITTEATLRMNHDE